MTSQLTGQTTASEPDRSWTGEQSEPSRMWPRDMLLEAFAGMFARPGRMLLTILGTSIGRCRELPVARSITAESIAISRGWG